MGADGNMITYARGEKVGCGNACSSCRLPRPDRRWRSSTCCSSSAANAGEWLRAVSGVPKIVGYVRRYPVRPLAAQLDRRRHLTQARPSPTPRSACCSWKPVARLDLRWLLGNPSLLRATAADVLLSFVAIFFFAWALVGLSRAGRQPPPR